MAFGILLLIILYFLPTIIAFSRGKRNKGAILALNLFLGWTFVGWIISLVWSLTHDGVVVIKPEEKKIE
ncbi:MAG: superinfection immunity protein [Minisyncoccia bacterium]